MGKKKKGRGRGGVSARRRRWRGARAKGGVRGPGEACSAGCAGQGRQRYVRPAIIAVGGRVWATGRRVARDGMVARKKRESEVRSAKRKDRNDKWNRMLEIGCLGQRKDFRELGFRF